MKRHQEKTSNELGTSPAIFYPPRKLSSLISRNLYVQKRRTSIRLEKEIWALFEEIAARERCTIHDIASLVYLRKNKEATLSSAIRVFIAVYYKSSSTEDGHIKARHGSMYSGVIR